jgi:predicted metal-binding membrane protein
MVATPRRVHSVSFLVISLLLFVASVMVTVIWGTAMSAMGGMPMPGGWTMSMAWMQMPGQTWTMTAVSFVGMWTVMMVAMMLPSLVPMLRRYREVVWSVAGARLGWLTVCVGAGYFFVWSLFGVAAFSLGVVLAAVEMRQPALARAVPIAAAIALLLAGAFQFSTWKAHHLACCRYESAPVPPLRGDPGSAWGYGVRLGVHCSSCCGSDRDRRDHSRASCAGGRARRACDRCRLRGSGCGVTRASRWTGVRAMPSTRRRGIFRWPLWPDVARCRLDRNWSLQ